jgi:hypothetical protein
MLVHHLLPAVPELSWKADQRFVFTQLPTPHSSLLIGAVFY